MEFWVVAAATGAGYVAKHWQNFSGGKNSPLQLSPVSSPRVQPDTCQLLGILPDSVSPLPKLAKRCLLEGDVSSPEDGHIKMGMNPQDNTDEIIEKYEYCDTSGHYLHEFRTKNSNTKAWSSLRPLVVTSNSIDFQKKLTTQADDVKDHKIMFMEENGGSTESELYEPTGLVRLRRRPEQKYVKNSETRNLHSKDNDMVSLFLGITIGILSTTVTNQREVGHLNELLEQAENMVQDLHKKLEIKDGFTRKEHGTEADGTSIDNSNTGNYELTSDIEAELEAELEKLEENIKDSNLQRLSNIVEIDSDFEADMARGDLNIGSLSWQLDGQSESDHDDKREKSESTGKGVFTPNYTVSSLDLRLRLHEVIESELRGCIEELEAVLKYHNSQSKPHSPEPQEESSFWDFDHTRIESSSSTP
uniref:uncharacterized protein LOC122602750 n=1 Tax=Erigeron canadensis TaxID=72917 RepID=UPI001CB942B8|nr:uncharacterized protein LOC122602750 [Erigeron canadensis]